MLRDIEVLEAIKRDDLAHLLILRCEKLVNLLPDDDTPEMLRHHPTSMQVCAFYGAEKCYFYLKKSKICQSTETNHYSTLHFAAAGGNERIIKDVIESGGDVSLGDFRGNTALHIAAKNSHLRACALLLENEAVLQCSNELKMTPAHYAAANGRIDILKLFFDKGDDMQDFDMYGCCPLYYAIKNGHREAALFLIEKDLFISDVQTFVSLNQEAAAMGLEDVVKALLAKGVSELEMNHNYWGIVHFAAANGSNEIIRHILTQYGVNAFRELDRVNRSVAHIAAINGHLNVIKEFENTELEVMTTLQDKQGYTPLMYACKFGHRDIVEYLLEKADLTKRSATGKTILMIAAENEQMEIVKIILKKNIDINEVDSKGKTALFNAVENGSFELITTFLDSNADATIASKEGTPLIAAAIMRMDETIFNELIKRNVPLTTKDAKGWTALHYAAQVGFTPALLNPDISALANEQDEEGKTPFGIAVFWNIDDFAEKMMEQEVDNCNVKDKEGNIALHYACKLNHVKLALSLIRNSKSDLNARNNEGMTPLLTAIDSWADQITEELISRVTCLANIADNRGLTPLLLAAKLGQSRTVLRLVYEPRVRCNVVSNAGMNAANYAAKQNDIRTLIILYQSGRVDLDKPYNGVTPLDLLENIGEEVYSDNNYDYDYEEEGYYEEDNYDYHYSDDAPDDSQLFLNSGEVHISRTNDDFKVCLQQSLSTDRMI